jgi:tRNA pseudouridine38-40 synthase
MKLAYDGTPFHGWQIQPNANTVQQEVEAALSTILGIHTGVVGCGRTDTGVHAKDYVLHFDCLSMQNTGKLRASLNGVLPSSIGISAIYEVKADAHARFDAVARSYEYKIVQEKNPFMVNRAYQFRMPLNIEAMNKAADYLLQVTDFASFCKVGSDAKTTFCKVTCAEWIINGKQLVFHITADRFLRNMVRAIVGTLLQVGLGKISVADFKGIIEKGHRSEAGASAPAEGLYLRKIVYPKNLLIENG